MASSEKGYTFTWGDLGNLEKGRPNLGSLTPITNYRLLEFSFKDVLTNRYGKEEAGLIFREAGFIAGREFCLNILNTNLEFNDFISELHKTLIEYKIGILRIEKADMEKGSITLTVSEDLDCSGLPISGETVCEYDEGFLSGILFAYTGKAFNTKEVDCWATGDRTCRFKITEIAEK